METTGNISIVESVLESVKLSVLVGCLMEAEDIAQKHSPITPLNMLISKEFTNIYSLSWFDII